MPLEVVSPTGRASRRGGADLVPGPDGRLPADHGASVEGGEGCGVAAGEGGVMMGEQPRPEPPFLVTMATYVIDFHHRNVCTRCGPDGSCPRLAEASDHLKAWRDRKAGGSACG